AARAGPELPPRRCRAAALRALYRADDSALLRGARVPARIPDPDHHLRARRRPAGVGVQPADPGRPGQAAGRALAADALAADFAGSLRGSSPDGAAPVPRPARRAVPAVPAICESLGRPDQGWKMASTSASTAADVR